MPLEHFFDLLQISFVQPLESDRFKVTAILHRAVLIQHVSDAAGHSRGEVAPRLADDDDPPASHIFAGVITHALDDRAHAAIAHTKTFPRHAANVSFSVGRAVKRHIADDDIFFRCES